MIVFILFCIRWFDRVRIVEIFQETMEKNQEGLIVKLIDSQYKPEARDRGGWLKLKPDYSDELVGDMDLVIMGAEYGEDRYVNTFRSYMVGVRDDDDNFYAVTSVSSGLNIPQIERLDHFFKPKARTGQPPAKLYFPEKWKNWALKSAQKRVWFQPDDSMVLTVKSSELIENQGYPLNRTLRFPRVKMLRDRSDRDASNCMTKEELLKIELKKGVNRFGNTNLSLEALAAVTDDGAKKRKTSPRKKDFPAVGAVTAAEREKLDELAKQAPETFFKGKQICVINTPFGKQQDIRQGVSELGAAPVFQPSIFIISV